MDGWKPRPPFLCPYTQPPPKRMSEQWAHGDRHGVFLTTSVVLRIRSRCSQASSRAWSWNRISQTTRDHSILLSRRNTTKCNVDASNDGPTAPKVAPDLDIWMRCSLSTIRVCHTTDKGKWNLRRGTDLAIQPHRSAQHPPTDLGEFPRTQPTFNSK